MRGGAASTGIWSGGLGIFTPNASTLNASYTPTSAEESTGSILLTLTTNDPSGTCLETSDDILITIDTLSTVYAGEDITSPTFVAG